MNEHRRGQNVEDQKLTYVYNFTILLKLKLLNVLLFKQTEENDCKPSEKEKEMATATHYDRDLQHSGVKGTQLCLWLRVPHLDLITGERVSQEELISQLKYKA